MSPTARTPVLAQDFLTLYRSPDPERVYCTTPGLLTLPSGRIVATCGVKARPPATLAPPLTPKGEGPFQWQTLVFTSDDGGRRWERRAVLPMLHARPFAAGRRVYVLGHAGDLTVAGSDDAGTTWGQTATLTEGEWWHQAACSVEYSRDRVYLVMEQRTAADLSRWEAATLAPVLLSAPTGADLCRRASWTFSNRLTFQEAAAAAGGLSGVGAPFHARMAAPGWLETNVVRFRDPSHLWHDPEGRTFYFWMRAHTGSTNLAAIARAVEDGDGGLTVGPAAAPSGAPLVYVPCPGGHLKFHIVSDRPSGLFWMASSQATDSLLHPDRLPPGRHGLPNNERQRLALYASTNCLDWQYAGLVATGAAPGQSRHYPSLTVSGEDLLVLSRSGDAAARNAHDCNLITLHRVERFRELVVP